LTTHFLLLLYAEIFYFTCVIAKIVVFRSRSKVLV